MKVKIGNRITDGTIQPVMVILSDQDKENIRNMAPDATHYCAYPAEKFGVEEIESWMRTGSKYVSSPNRFEAVYRERKQNKRKQEAG